MRACSVALFDDLRSVGAVDDAAIFVIDDDLIDLFVLIDEASTHRENRDALVHQVESARLQFCALKAVAHVAIDEAIEPNGLAGVD